MIGPIVNGSAIIVGSVVGVIFGNRIPGRIRNTLLMTFGTASMALGIAMIVRIKEIPAVILALLLGVIVGECFQIERWLQAVAAKARIVIEKLGSANDPDLSQEEFLNQFVALTVLFCTSGMGIFGAMTEGITNNSSMLTTKAILDLFTSAIFATSLGYSVTVIALPQFVIQTALLLGAKLIFPLTTPIMIADFSACGGVIMLVTGFRIYGIKQYPIANLLPALVLVMPMSFLWLKYLAG